MLTFGVFACVSAFSLLFCCFSVFLGDFGSFLLVVLGFGSPRFRFRIFGGRVECNLTLTFADGHTASNAPDLFRPPKLSGAGPG